MHAFEEESWEEEARKGGEKRRGVVERERESETKQECLYKYIHIIHIYMYVHICMCKYICIHIRTHI